VLKARPSWVKLNFCAWFRLQPFPGVITSLQTHGAKY